MKLYIIQNNNNKNEAEYYVKNRNYENYNKYDRLICQHNNKTGGFKPTWRAEHEMENLRQIKEEAEEWFSIDSNISWEQH